jgi:hypothetical protein
MDPDCYRLALGFYSSFVVNEDVNTDVAQTTAPSRQSSTGERASVNMMLTTTLTKVTVTPSKETVAQNKETTQPKEAVQVKEMVASTKETAPRQPQRQPDAAKLPSWRESLAYLSLLVPAFAYAQSFVGGDLSTQAPYGLPAQDFAVAISNPASDASFSITGYNTSLAAGSVKATENTINGWSLNISVTANVPLANSFSNAINKELCIDATTLSITPPAGVAHYNSTSWRVCAIVFTGGLKAGGSTRSDGSCSAALPDECVRQLETNSVAGKAGRNGGCRDLDIPGPCAGHFNGDTGTGFGTLCFLLPNSYPSRMLTDGGTQKSHPSATRLLWLTDARCSLPRDSSPRRRATSRRLRLLSAMSGRCCWRGRTSLRLARSMTALGGCRVPNRPIRRRWPVWVGA